MGNTFSRTDGGSAGGDGRKRQQNDEGENADSLAAFGAERKKHRIARHGDPSRKCNICYDQTSEGLECSGGAHFICSDCAEKEVQRVLDELQEPPQLQRHRARGGRIKCVEPDCQQVYAEQALARVLPGDVFTAYRASQDEAVEQRLFEQLQQRFQDELRQKLEERQSHGRAASARQADEATAEFLRRQYPNAVQCPHCRAGPVIPENCADLNAHHRERLANGRGQISNACHGCGFFSRDRGNWSPWDGHMRNEEQGCVSRDVRVRDEDEYEEDAVEDEDEEVDDDDDNDDDDDDEELKRVTLEVLGKANLEEITKKTVRRSVEKELGLVNHAPVPAVRRARRAPCHPPPAPGDRQPWHARVGACRECIGTGIVTSAPPHLSRRSAQLPARV